MLQPGIQLVSYWDNKHNGKATSSQSERLTVIAWWDLIEGVRGWGHNLYDEFDWTVVRLWTKNILPVVQIILKNLTLEKLFNSDRTDEPRTKWCCPVQNVLLFQLGHQSLGRSCIKADEPWRERERKTLFRRDSKIKLLKLLKFDFSEASGQIGLKEAAVRMSSSQQLYSVTTRISFV